MSWRGALVDVEDVQVDVVEPVALGQRLRELPGVDDAGVDQRLAERNAGAPAALHHLLDELALGEAELDDDVADAALDPGALRGRDRGLERGTAQRRQPELPYPTRIGSEPV